ncbi:phosphatidylethanolamine-binding protein [Achaetomium macrosporum]|uniref:Phosphatidylethanolamine-binding protein n=1 Tax=Achaetomium macrosporum TaxID=79813 RepID=A0AAN7C1T9_9PEZI|nr:phosphatidylethanolamine-binding protein [Achaetomium macrosporum]
MPASKTVEQALATLEKDKSKALGLALAKHASIEPGQFVPRADAQAAPELFIPAGSPEKTYMVVCLDPDAPFASFPILGPVNHWCQSGLRLSAAEGNGKLETSDPFLVDYIGPGPPPGAAPHRYVFLLYEQPANFDIKAHASGKHVGVGGRARYDLEAWEKKIGLGEVVAVNYFKSN